MRMVAVGYICSATIIWWSMTFGFACIYSRNYFKYYNYMVKLVEKCDSIVNFVQALKNVLHIIFNFFQFTFNSELIYNVLEGPHQEYSLKSTCVYDSIDVWKMCESFIARGKLWSLLTPMGKRRKVTYSFTIQSPCLKLK